MFIDNPAANGQTYILSDGRSSRTRNRLETLSGKIAFDENRNPVKPAVILRIVEGRQAFQTWVSP